MPDSHRRERQPARPIPIGQPRSPEAQEKRLKVLGYTNREATPEGKRLIAKIVALGYVYSKAAVKNGKLELRTEPSFFALALAAHVPFDAVAKMIFESDPRIDSKHRRAIEFEVNAGDTLHLPEAD